jgi:F-type H+-transporting ATPase subunit b
MYLLLFAETIQLFPDGTLFIHIALILLMIWVLNRTLFRPINRVLEAREAAKGGAGGAAGEILAEVEAKQSKYAEELRAARSEGYSLIEQEQAKAAAERERVLNQAKAAAAAKLESGRSAIETQTAEARNSIAQNAEAMAEKISSSILRS